MYTQIVHLGDIHIRCGNESSSRYAEYMAVFKNLEERLLELESIKNQTAIVAICGDIFHNKTKMESFGIRVWSSMISMLTKLAPVVMICGNHDFRQEDPTIPDLIEVMTEQLTDTTFPCYYLDKTGTHVIENIEFGIVTVKDTLSSINTSGLIEELPPFPSPSNSECIPVALFHGTISQSSLPNGQLMGVGKGYPLEWFKEYPLVLLGDNHKQQVNTSSWGMKWGYPGSLVQQDIGEPVFGHGFILWDLDTRTGTPVHVYNPYGMVKIRKNSHGEYQARLDNFKFTDIVSAIDTPYFPRKPSLLVLGNQGDEVPVIDILRTHRISPSSVRTTVASFQDVNEDIANEQTVQVISEIANLNNPDKWLQYIETLDSELATSIREYSFISQPKQMLMDTVSPDISGELNELTQKIRGKIENLIDIYHECGNESRAERHRVVLKHMSWDWTFSYGENNWFNFETMEGKIALLNGMNASGKSAFIDTICIGLFGEPSLNRQINSTKKMTGYCIHNKRPPGTGSDSMNVKIIFQMDDGLYEIVRKFKHCVAEMEGKQLSVDLYSINQETNERVPMRSGSILVNEWMDMHCGTIEDIMKTSIVSQLDNHNFFFAKPDVQKTMIDHAVNLKELQSFSDIVHEAVNGYNNLLKTLSTILQTKQETALNTSVVDVSLSEEDFLEKTREYEEMEQRMAILETERDKWTKIAGNLQNIPSGSVHYWKEQLMTIDVSDASSYADKDKELYEKYSILSHRVQELQKSGENGLKCDGTSIEELNKKLESCNNLLEQHLHKKPPPGRTEEQIVSQWNEIESWKEIYNEWCQDTDSFYTEFDKSKEDLSNTEKQYEAWNRAMIDVPICVDGDVNIDAVTEHAKNDWKDARDKYLQDKQLYDELCQKITQYTEIVGDKDITNDVSEKSWKQEYDNYLNAVAVCEKNKWENIDECKNALDKTVSYIHKKKLLEEDLHNTTDEIERTANILNTYSGWKEEYNKWCEQCKQFENYIEKKDDCEISEAKNMLLSLQEWIENEKKILDKHYHLESTIKECVSEISLLRKDPWWKNWNAWKKEADRCVKYHWESLDSVKDDLAEYEFSMQTYHLWNQKRTELEKELQDFYKENPHPECESCKHRKTKLEESIREICQQIESFDVEMVQKYIKHFQKAVTCVTYVSSIRNLMEETHSEITASIENHENTIKTCMSDMDILWSGDNKRNIQERQTYWDNQVKIFEEIKEFTLSYAEKKDKYSWFKDLERRIHKLYKHRDTTIARIEKMESHESLIEKKAYWKEAVDTLEYVIKNKEYIQREKDNWEKIHKYKHLINKYQDQYTDAYNILQNSWKRAYHLWVISGGEICERMEQLRDHIRKMEDFITNYEKQSELQKLLENEIKQARLYRAWDEKRCLLEKHLRDTKDSLLYLEYYDTKAIVDKYEIYKTAHVNVAWFELQEVRNEISSLAPKLSFARDTLLLEKYKRGRVSDENRVSVRVAQLYTLHKKWTEVRDILQRLDERLVGEKGKMKGSSDKTYKEWIYQHHVLPMLEKQVNRFLEMIGVDVRFRIEYGVKQLKYLVIDRGNTTSFASSSGFQQFVIGLGMRQALAIVGGSGNNLQHMFIDEGFTACDSVNIEKSHEMLQALINMGHYKSILLVSHLESIKETVPLKINLVRKDAFTKLNFGTPYPVFSNSVVRRGKPSKKK